MKQLDNWLIHAVSLKLNNSKKTAILIGYCDNKRKIIFGIKAANIEKGIIKSDEDDLYLLGSPNKEYEKAYPNAREKFLDRLRGNACQRQIVKI